MRKKLVCLIVFAIVATMVVPAFGVTTDSGGHKDDVHDYASDRIIVKFADNAAAVEKRAIKASYKLETNRKFKMGAETMMVNGSMPVEQVVEALNMNDKVEYAELDYVLEASKIQAESIPSDSMLSSLWGMDNIDAQEAWAIEQGRGDVIVAVIDTGVQIDHPDLDANIWTNSGEIPGNEIDDDGNGYEDDVNGWDFCNNDNTVYDGTFDDHGTHVSGTIAAEADGDGVVGVAPNVVIMPLKFIASDGYGYSSDAAYAVEYAGDNGAKIINASWGGGGYSNTLKTAIDEFGTDHGGVFVAAAGNGGDDFIGDNNDLKPHYPSSYNCGNIIAVASLDNDYNNDGLYEKSDFSNYGTESVDVFAPGAAIKSTVPYNAYESWYGTSMATPHVSGVLALMISHEMNVNNLTADSELLRSPELLINDVMESVVYDSYYANYVKSGGRLNAYNALLLTPEYGTKPPDENQPPVNDPKQKPTISSESDVIQVGVTLTANPGGWTDDNDDESDLIFTYSWKVKVNKNRTVTVDSGETIVIDGYEGKGIYVEVTAEDSGGLTTIVESELYEILPADTEPVDPPVYPPTEDSFNVSIISPVSGARNVATNEVIELSFSEAIDLSSVDVTALSLVARVDTVELTNANVSFSEDRLKGFIALEEGVTYLPKTKYTLTVNTNFVQNAEDEYLTEKLVTYFTTIR
ncbi:Serine protease, subtilisin family [Dethiosulfatibacter aminovorans DSM 17477]|uniref:Serine protease, subtilisin family n=1 Tax=Dethiosulfatibacter aminovorans DSM 17477 TaxID=1121476 RepID=A0A1M6IK85_9FIRM|nr:S8 family serine peptidase [Dethiosulfatibacter aminovorans]SHJ34787.1 Serine protease, subtilisin family [Dethiosulfatibacter aminovorans DSM 17477]